MAVVWREQLRLCRRGGEGGALGATRAWVDACRWVTFPEGKAAEEGLNSEEDLSGARWSLVPKERSVWCGEKRGRAQRSEKASRGETLRKQLGGIGLRADQGRVHTAPPGVCWGLYTTHAAGRWGESLWRPLEI